MKTGGVIVAMPSEYEALRKSGVERVALSGIGKVNAARTAAEMILRERPDYIINSGVAGSVKSSVGVFDIVLGAEVAYHDVWCGGGLAWGQLEDYPIRFPADPVLLEKARSVQTDLPVHTGLICSGDQFFISMEEDARILRLYPDCLACDMESAAIAQVCHYYHVPFLSLRVISDVHTDEQRQKTSYDAFWNQLKDNSFCMLRHVLDSL